jgi:methyl-accepting chemotaxis protein
MDEMTQHNAALVEETNAAIEQTETQAQELDRVVDVFSFEDRGAANTAPRNSVRAMQERVRGAAKTYQVRGNTAVSKDWAEF